MGIRLVFVLISLLAVIQAATPDRIIVVHRHGARTPLVDVNRSGLCKPSGRCGRLTAEGKDMLYQLGKYLRQTYNSTIPYATYEPGETVQSRSTDTARTLQSGSEVIKGLFSHLAETHINEEHGFPDSLLDPVISTVPIKQDSLLLVWAGLPSLALLQEVWNDVFLSAMKNQTLQIMSQETLQVLGKEVGLSEECDFANETTFNPFQCALDLQDVWSCNRAQGYPFRFPELNKYGPRQLTQVLVEYNKWAEWVFDDKFYDGSFIREAGTLGYNLATQISQDASEKSPTKMFHYSGHDITLMPLWQTMGNTTLLDPGFGAAMIFEVFQEAENTFVVAKVGEPDQLPGDHSYTFSQYPLWCMNSSNMVYESLSGCPLDDWQRFLETRGPQSHLGDCYTNTSMLAAVGCDPAENRVPLTRACKQFRQSCTLTACGSQHYVTKNLLCEPIVSQWHKHKKHKKHHHITVGILSGAVGVLAVSLGVLVWMWNRKHKKEQGEYLTVS